MSFIKLENTNMQVYISKIGAGLADVKIRNEEGDFVSMLAHPYDEQAYNYATSYFGKPCGRSAGRIANHRFTINDKDYIIPVFKDEVHALHGGSDNISYKVFKDSYEENECYKKVSLVYLSKDLESGFPGNLSIKISFILYNNENKLRIEHNYFSDKDTVCNLTCHAYFNLSGDVKNNILEDELQINTNLYTPVPSDRIPTKICEAPKEFSFVKPHKIKDYIETKIVKENTNGYDHAYYFCDDNPLKAILSDELSGRKLKIYSSYETLVLYTCNYPEDIVLKNGNKLKKYDAVCLEMQHFPNGVNSDFIKNKKDVIKANKEYSEFIEYLFL